MFISRRHAATIYDASSDLIRALSISSFGFDEGLYVNSAVISVSTSATDAADDTMKDLFVIGMGTCPKSDKATSINGDMEEPSGW